MPMAACTFPVFDASLGELTTSVLAVVCLCARGITGCPLPTQYTVGNHATCMCFHTKCSRGLIDDIMCELFL